MRRKTTITVILLLSVVRCHADDGRGYYVDPDMTHEEARRITPPIDSAIRYFIGYINPREYFLSTIGEMSRVADAIIVARVHEVTDLTDDQSPVRDRIRKPYSISLDVEQILAGNLPSNDSHRIVVSGRLGERVRISWLPQASSKVIAFLKVREGQISAQWEGYTGLRGYVYLDKENEEIVEIVKQYIDMTRGDAYLEESYFDFLYGMIQYGNGKISSAAPPNMPAVRRALLYGSERIKTDARRSMVWLLGRYDNAKLEAIRRRPGIDEDLATLIDMMLEYRRVSPRLRRRTTPNQEELDGIRKLLQSDEADRIREGMRLMSRYPKWRDENKDWWGPYMKRHLEHEDVILRLSIAQRIAWANHSAGVTVLVNDGLQHSDWVERASSQRFLERMLGEAIDFDPRGPEDERKQQVEVFKQWWEENKHRYEYE